MTSRVRREAGILLPLFSLRSDGDWGIGEIGALPGLCTWLAAAGHRVLQLLPINEVSPGERSPYAALSAFALDPLYLSVGALEDFVAAGGEQALSEGDRATLVRLRTRSGIDHRRVRILKRRALAIAFERFRESEVASGSARAQAFERFREQAADWLTEYALFRALHEERGEASWRTWEPALRDRDPAALAAAHVRRQDASGFHAYVQWVAAEQWQAARRAANAASVRLKGDLPFMVNQDSADVWARQAEFSLDASLGAPPDAFNADGQDWGLPVCRWDVMADNGFAWVRARAARAAALFDAFRLDHVIGLYRMYVIAPDGTASFVPEDEAEQRALGERLLGVLREAANGTQVIGEDLGVVPEFVRESLARLGIPGYRVLRWETKEGVFRDPVTYPPVSVATSGTHDTSSLATWWTEELDDETRQALAAVPAFRALADATDEFTPAVHAALLDGLYAAGSDLVVIPFPDAYGGRERINVPATVGESNWSYRAPFTVSELNGEPGAALRDQLRQLALRHGR